ncbi:MAG: response regulator [Deltaproteobacteria bacterium]|nr:response regulator [Deltaproteobacteria bacterium]
MEQGRLILLVEDNPDDQLLIRRALSKDRVKSQIFIANDGLEALDYLFRHGKFTDRDPLLVPGLVILDLNVPKVSGLEVLQEIRKNATTRFLPVIIFSSSREERDVLDGYQLGANSYVIKPVDSKEFEEAVRQLGTYWLSLNELVPPHKA